MTDKQKDWIRSIGRFLEASSINQLTFNGEKPQEVFPDLFKPAVQKYRLKMDVMGFEKDTIWIIVDGLHVCYKEYKLPLKNFHNFMVYFETVCDEPVPAPIIGKLLSRITSIHHDHRTPFQDKIDINLDGSLGAYRAQGSLYLTGLSTSATDIDKIKEALEGYLEVKLLRK